MGRNVDEIVVGSNGAIYKGAIGSPIPGSILDPLDPDAWIDLGYASEDGVTWTVGKSKTPVRAWQSFWDLRRVVESMEATATFSLLQWNGDTVKLAWGGGDIVEPEPGAFRYVPPPPQDTDEGMLAIEWSDGAKDYRLILPKGDVSDTVETNITRTDAGMLPITFSLLGSDNADPFYFDTNDPAFAGAVGSGS